MADAPAELMRKLEVCERLLRRLEIEIPRREQTIIAVRSVQALAQSQLDSLKRSEESE
jgi:hypothetical protein